MVYIMLRTNRTFTDDLFPFFEIMYALEMLFTLIFYCLVPVTLSMLWNAQPLHRNLRLSLCNLVVQGVMGTTARVILVCNLYVGNDQLEERPSVIAASVARCTMIEAFVGIFLFFAVERLVATLAWSWYEKGSLCTIIVFILAEGCALLWSWSWSIALVFEFVNSKQMIAGGFCWMAIGVAVALFVITTNYRAMSDLKKGARINQYSVARTFQIRENVVIIKALLKIAARIFVLSMPVVVLLTYLNMLSGENGDRTRLIARAFFDLTISLYLTAIISYIPLSDAIFERSLKKTELGRRLFAAFSIAHFQSRRKIDAQVTVNETDYYFNMLAVSLNGPPMRPNRSSQ